jgi:6-phosphogluconolactonase
MTNADTPYWVFIGTYTEQARAAGHPSEGVYVYRLNPADGTLTYAGSGDPGPNPSFLAVHPTGRYVYAVNEVERMGDRRGGGVTAFAFDRATGQLSRLNQESAHGTVSCHISVDGAGRYALAANYGSGDVLVLPIEPDGTVRPASQIVDHVSLVPGAEPGTARAHSLTLDPAQRYALAADLGLDRVMIYQYDGLDGKLTLNSHQPWVQTAKGAGPRHLDFHPNGRYVYLINELNATVTALAYGPEQGTLTELQTLSALPAGYEGVKSCADIHVSPDGRFVYGSNRGHDSLVIFAIDPATGLLTLVGHTATQGRTPRNFALDPTGTYLFAANQDSHQIVTFRRDAATGQLTPTGQVTDVPMPVCIKFLAAA